MPSEKRVIKLKVFLIPSDRYEDTCDKAEIAGYNHM
jgi:hypothetical protein